MMTETRMASRGAGADECRVEVSADKAGAVFHLTTPTTSYAMSGAHGSASLRHLYWGPRISGSDVALLAEEPTPEWRSSVSIPRGVEEESPAYGGLRTDDVVLAAVFDDGTRALDLRVVGWSIEEELDALVVRVDQRDLVHALSVTTCYRVRVGSDVVTRWCEITNNEPRSVALLVAASASWAVPASAGERFTTATGGGWIAESSLQCASLPVGRLVLESRTGTPGHLNQPWVSVDSDASQQHGDVYSMLLAWSGSWKISARRSADVGVQVTLGRHDVDSPIRLAAGHAMVTPESLGVFSRLGHCGITHEWHNYLRKHVIADPDVLRPVLYNSWEATSFDVSHDQQLALARVARDIGVELFVVDDGWYGSRRDDSRGLGDWSENRHRFPGGLGALAQEVHGLGMRFGVWIEPEMVNRDSDLFRAHPDWVYGYPGHVLHEARNQLVLDVGRPEVREWMWETIDGLLTRVGIDYIKWDMNRPLADAAPLNDPGAPTWISHVEAVYEVLDRIRAAHPDVLIETCSGGGGRADAAMLSHTHQAWPSDNTDPLDRLTIQQGYSYIAPASTMACWVTDSPYAIVTRETPLEFRFHVAMCGVLGIGADISAWDESELATATGFIAEYKGLRPIIQGGRMDRLGRDPTTEGVQYTLADEVVAFGFRRTTPFGPDTNRLVLHDLPVGTRWRHESTGRTYSAELLTGRGMSWISVGDCSSILVHLQRVSA